MNRLRTISAASLLSLTLAGCSSGGAAVLQTAQPDSPTTAAAATAAPAATTGGAATAAPAPTTAPAATASSAPTAASGAEQSDDAIKADLQKVLDQWSKAFNNNSPEELRKAVDQTNLPFRRLQETYLRKYVAEQGRSRDWDTTLGTINRKPNGYIQADVTVGGGVQTFVFKQYNGAWKITEPRRAELGPKKKLETEHFTVQYYDWDADIAADLGKLMEEVHTADVTKMTKGPTKKTLVQLIPTAEVTPAGSDAGTLAYYRRGSGSQIGTQEMVINSPNSFESYTRSADATWQDDLRVTLAHEYAHLINDCCFSIIARQANWMTEGLAVYVSEGGYTSGFQQRRQLRGPERQSAADHCQRLQAGPASARHGGFYRGRQSGRCAARLRPGRDPGRVHCGQLWRLGRLLEADRRVRPDAGFCGQRPDRARDGPRHLSAEVVRRPQKAL